MLTSRGALHKCTQNGEVHVCGTSSPWPLRPPYCLHVDAVGGGGLPGVKRITTSLMMTSLSTGSGCQYARTYTSAEFGSQVVVVMEAGSASACEQVYAANVKRVEVQGWYWDGYTGCSLLNLGMQRMDGISQAECLKHCSETAGCQSIRYIATAQFCVLSAQLTGMRIATDREQDLVIGCGNSGAPSVVLLSLLCGFIWSTSKTHHKSRHAMPHDWLVISACKAQRTLT